MIQINQIKEWVFGKAMDTKSELIIDIEASTAKAFDERLPKAEQELVREHLAYILTKLREPNTLIVPAKEALAVMKARQQKSWYEHPVGIIVLGVIVAGIVYSFGWN